MEPGLSELMSRVQRWRYCGVLLLLLLLQIPPSPSRPRRRLRRCLAPRLPHFALFSPLPATRPCFLAACSCEQDLCSPSHGNRFSLAAPLFKRPSRLDFAFILDYLLFYCALFEINLPWPLVLLCFYYYYYYYLHGVEKKIYSMHNKTAPFFCCIYKDLC